MAHNTSDVRRLVKYRGFTLVELVVVIAMLAVLTLGLLFTFNPITQFNKARDGQREHDLQQLQEALDTYYNDTHCYPQTLTGFSTKYMQKVPTDPDGTKTPYFYQTDGNSCPQWSVLYAALKAPVVPKNPCPLTSRTENGTECVPQDFPTSQYNYCVLSGNIDCAYISSSTVGFPQGGGGSGGAPTPTPTPYPVNCPSGNYYGCTGQNMACNSENPPTICIGHGGTIQCYCDSSCMVGGKKQCPN